jgi:hypothetical protein
VRLFEGRTETPDSKQPKGRTRPGRGRFSYDLLETKVAEKVRSSADRIRERVKKTVEDIIEVGNDLLAVKEALEHGQFGPWLKAEFGWSERTAQNVMSVCGRAGHAGQEEGQGLKTKCSALTNRRRANVHHDEHPRSRPRRPGP